MKDVLRSPEENSGSASTACKNDTFVETPRILNSASARRARITAASKLFPRAISFTSIESKCGEISAPVETVPPSSLIPAPPGER